MDEFDFSGQRALVVGAGGLGAALAAGFGVAAAGLSVAFWCAMGGAIGGAILGAWLDRR